MSVLRHLRIANSLPPSLKTFFEKYPPPALLNSSTPAAPLNSSTPAAPPVAETASTVVSSDSNATQVDRPVTLQEPAIGNFYLPKNIPAEAQAGLPYPNPFLPRKNHTTGRWYGPVYGLRRQAELVKLAQKHDVLDLLPWTIKKPGEKERRFIEKGLRVKGTGEGQKVKGKSWERTLKGRMEVRRKAMMEMPALIQEWKQKGHGRGWKKYPSGKAKK